MITIHELKWATPKVANPLSKWEEEQMADKIVKKLLTVGVVCEVEVEK